jgi:hypothetical protein
MHDGAAEKTRLGDRGGEDAVDLFDKPLDEREAWELMALADIIKFVDFEPSPDFLARLISMKRLIRSKAGKQ